MEHTKGTDIESQVLEAIKEVLNFNDPKTIKASIILARIRTILGLRDLASVPDLYKACITALQALPLKRRAVRLKIEQALAKVRSK